jgi:hypothetical protein
MGSMGLTPRFQGPRGSATRHALLERVEPKARRAIGRGPHPFFLSRAPKQEGLFHLLLLGHALQGAHLHGGSKRLHGLHNFFNPFKGEHKRMYA